MIKYTLCDLEAEGYTIENAKITSVDLSMGDHSCLTSSIVLKGAGWGCSYGGYCLGHGYLGAPDDFFDGSPQGIEYIERIMDVVGVGRFNDLPGKYVRVATKGWGSPIKIIGNIINDKWFDSDSFFKDKEAEEDVHSGDK